MTERTVMRLLEQQVRRSLPSVGVCPYNEVERLVAAGVHSWGNTELDGARVAFLVCRTPASYPSATVLVGDSLSDILDVLVSLGSVSGLELEQLLEPPAVEN